MTDTTETLINAYIAAQPPSKGADLTSLRQLVRAEAPDARLWFLDGRDETGKRVTNPNIGYGQYTIAYADGSRREFYRIGLSANTAGISVYIMGREDKTFLAQTYGERLGKAAVTGYCIRFKRLADIDVGVLREAIADGLALGDMALGDG